MCQVWVVRFRSVALGLTVKLRQAGYRAREQAVPYTVLAAACAGSTTSRSARVRTVILLEEAVSQAFPDSASVNQALRLLLRLAHKQVKV
jgi:hypothetical protein